MRRKTEAAPTDEEILAQDNVPVAMAAAYIKQSSATIYLALQQSRAPFGFASQNEKTDTWTYNISPGLLVAYKRGQLPMYRIDDIIRMAAAGVNQVIDQRLGSINQVVSHLLGGGAA